MNSKLEAFMSTEYGKSEEGRIGTMDGWTVRIDGRMDGWVDGRTDGWT